MLSQARGPALALGLTLLLAATAAGQAPPPPPAPVAAAPWRLDPAGPGCGPPACAPYEDRNGPLLVGDPLLDGPACPGWLAAVDVGVVVPHVRSNVFGF